MSAPVLDYGQLGAWARERKTAGVSLGFTCGSFDILHAGHVSYLEQARRECNQLIVAVNSDESVRSYKNPLRPIIPEDQRAALVAALRCVDAVTIMGELRPVELLKLITPDFYIKGGDYNPANLRSAPLVEGYGGRVILIPVEHQVSTTSIISRIAEIASYSEISSTAGKPKNLRIVFLDRDGTLIENVPFLRDPAEVRLLPGVAEGLKALQDAGYLLVVVTNQQGIGLGYFDYQQFVAVNSQMLRLLTPNGVRISRFYYCPHTLADGCLCRKPGKEMIEKALSFFKARGSDCFVIGDSAMDMEAADGAGCHGVLLTREVKGAGPHPRASNFAEATRIVIEQGEERLV